MLFQHSYSLWIKHCSPVYSSLAVIRWDSSQCIYQVQLDREVHTLVWPNRADFDPATLHDWPTQQEALIQRVKTWQQVSA